MARAITRDEIKCPAGVTARFELITPAQARTYLALNFSGNRNLNAKKVDQYKRDILAGRFFSYAQVCFGFPKDGGEQELIDGQHLLHAIIESRKSLWVMIVRSLSFEARISFDQGRRRTTAATLHVYDQDMRNTASMAGAVRWSSGYDQYAARKIPAVRIVHGKDITPSNAEIVEYLEANPGLEHAVAFAKRLYDKGMKAAAGAMAMVIYQTEKLNPNASASFFEQLDLGYGDDFRPDSPIYTLRSRLTRIRKSGEGGSDATHRDCAAIILAYNAFRRGQKTMKKISFPSDGNFPVIAK